MRPALPAQLPAQRRISGFPSLVFSIADADADADADAVDMPEEFAHQLLQLSPAARPAAPPAAAAAWPAAAGCCVVRPGHAGKRQAGRRGLGAMTQAPRVKSSATSGPRGGGGGGEAEAEAACRGFACWVSCCASRQRVGVAACRVQRVGPPRPHALTPPRPHALAPSRPRALAPPLHDPRHTYLTPPRYSLHGGAAPPAAAAITDVARFPRTRSSDNNARTGTPSGAAKRHGATKSKVATPKSNKKKKTQSGTGPAARARRVSTGVRA